MRIYIILLLLPLLTKGQSKSDSLPFKTRNIVWTIPVAKNTTINGLAIGLFPVTWGKAKHLNINGVTISGTPIDPFLGLYFVSSPSDTNSLYFKPNTASQETKINGLMIGTLTTILTKFNGVNISAVINAAQNMNGITIAGLFSQHYSFHGVSIAGLRNWTVHGNGVQIGLFNTCKEGKVVQVGLINKIGKRVTPFLNFQL